MSRESSQQETAGVGGPQHEPAGGEWQRQGQHRFRWEGDLVIFELHGMFNIDDALCLFRLSDAQAEKHGYVLSLFDAHDGMNMTQEARRLVGDRLRRQSANQVTAIVGATLAMKTVTRLIQNASRLFGFPIKPVQFCDSLEEAMTWLDVQRQQLIAKLQRASASGSVDASKP